MRPVALIGLLLLWLAPAASAAAPPAAELESAVAGSGGAIAHPLRQGDGGGGMAPRPAPAEPEHSAIGEAETIAGPVQKQPSTPAGEQQPEENEPPAEGEHPVEVEEEEKTGHQITPPIGTNGGDDGSERAGFASGLLPSTDLGLALLGVIGLGLLVAGVSIRRPRRSALSR